MSSFELYPSSHHLIVHSDFEGERAKAQAVFLADLFSPGGTTPGDLAPRSWEDVDIPIAQEVNPETVQRFCQLAGIELEIM